MKFRDLLFGLNSDHVGIKRRPFGKALVPAFLPLAPQALLAAASAGLATGGWSSMALGLGRALLLMAAVFCLCIVFRRQRRRVAARESRMAVSLAAAVREATLLHARKANEPAPAWPFLAHSESRIR